MASRARKVGRSMDGAATPTPVASNRQLVEEVMDTGWVVTQLQTAAPGRRRDAIMALARAFGTITAMRGRNAIDELRPRARREARPGSMSAATGLGAQPWHMDMAHRPLPARFVLLSCVDAGQQDCATELLDWRQSLPGDDLDQAASEPMRVRSGRASFYATMLDPRRRFLRCDPTCISGLTDAGRALQIAIGRASCIPTHQVCWQPGRTLIFDNWRLLHRRADASRSRQRTLLRISIMGQANDC